MYLHPCVILVTVVLLIGLNSGQQQLALSLSPGSSPVIK